MTLGLTLKPTTFTEWIEIFLVLQTITIIALYIIGGKNREQPTPSRKLQETYQTLTITLAIATLFLGAFGNTSEYARPLTYFILIGIMTAFIIYGKMNKLVSNSVLLFTLITILVSIPGLVYIRNNLYPIYDARRESLYLTGSIREYMEGSAKGGYYYFIPVEPMITVPLSYATGITSTWLQIIKHTIFYTTILLGLTILGKRSKEEYAIFSFLGIFMATQLSFEGRILPVPFTIISLALAILYLYKGNTTTLTLYILSTLTMVFSHPVGPLTIIIIYLTALFLYTILKPRSNNNYLQYTRLKMVTLTVLMISFAYWFSTYLYTLLVKRVPSVMSATLNFINTLLGSSEQSAIITGKTISRYAAPGYSDPRFHIFAYPWALLAAIPLVVSLLLILKSNRNIARSNILVLIGVGASIGSIIAVSLSFAQYVFGKEPGQYFIPIYQLLSAISLFALITSFAGKNKISLLGFSLLIASGVALGIYSPDWAPLEHPDFGSSITIKYATNQIEAEPLNKYTSSINKMKTYSVYDFPFGARGKEPSYILDQIMYGTASPYKGMLLGLKRYMINSKQYGTVNLLYNTGRHILVEI